ncbi:hypothetical protein FACS1894155_12620 [Bacteroidia bacterium]|nr:hypothetical protein FACS1894155_12620 [Bacteroidia bacterium]
MKRLITVIFLFFLFVAVFPDFVISQEFVPEPGIPNVETEATDMSFHQILKRNFIEGSAFFMSFIALALVVGLAFSLKKESLFPVFQAGNHYYQD